MIATYSPPIIHIHITGTLPYDYISSNLITLSCKKNEISFRVRIHFYRNENIFFLLIKKNIHADTFTLKPYFFYFKQK